MVTLTDIMDSEEWGKCTLCQKRPIALAFPSPGLAKELPSYGIPTWCEHCLKTEDWTIHYHAMVRVERLKGKRQS